MPPGNIIAIEAFNEVVGLGKIVPATWGSCAGICSRGGIGRGRMQTGLHLLRRQILLTSV